MPHSVLVVDDDRSVRVSLVRALRTRGYRAAEVGGGEEAIQKALESPPDVIVMDLMMPLQSGAEVARAIRREPTLARVPIIALSASPWLANHPDPLFVCVLTKPCRLSTLIDAITQAVGH